MQLLIWRLVVICEPPGHSDDSESNLHAWRLAAGSVLPGNRCREMRDEGLGVQLYMSPARQSGGLMCLGDTMKQRYFACFDVRGLQCVQDILKVGLLVFLEFWLRIGVKHVIFLELWLKITSLELWLGIASLEDVEHS